MNKYYFIKAHKQSGHDIYPEPSLTPIKYSVHPLQLQGCAFSNAAGLLVATLAFCLYCYGLSVRTTDHCTGTGQMQRRYSTYRCPFDVLAVSLSHRR